MLKIAHISDLHFGDVRPPVLAALIASLRALKPDAIVATGDVTMAGRRREFQEAKSFMAQLTAPYVVVPGNHDAPVYDLFARLFFPWRRFKTHLSTTVDPVLATRGLIVFGMNSARRVRPSVDWSKGAVSNAQLSVLHQRLKTAPQNVLKIVALHHPVVPGPGRAGRAVVSNAAALKQVAAFGGADVVMTGHAHVADAGIQCVGGRRLLLLAAGTATSGRLRGEAPSFNLLVGDRRALSVEIIRYHEDEFRTDRRLSFRRIDEQWSKDGGA